MTKTFDNWTAYDDWLIENYSLFSIQEVNEVTDPNTNKSIIKIECKEKEVPAKK